MWLVKLLPEWFFILSIIIGGLVFFATLIVKYIPFIYRYVVPLQLLSLFLVVFGVYFTGAAANEARWQDEVKELKTQVLIAEERARNISSKVEYIFLDKVQRVKDTQVVVQEKLRDISVTIDSKCKIDPDAINLLNAAARNEKPGAAK